jgi:hypothetical protein
MLEQSLARRRHGELTRSRRRGGVTRKPMRGSIRLQDVAAASPLQRIECSKGGLQLVKDLVLLVVIKRICLGNEIDEAGEVRQRGLRRFR